jgi:PAS domain S-box-containing protein
MDGKSTYEALEQRVKGLEKEIAKRNQEKEALRKACEETEYRMNQQLKQEIEENAVIEPARKDSQRLLQTLIDTIKGEVFVKDTNGKYLFVNNAYGKDFGVDPKAVIGKDDFFVFSPETAEILQKNDRRIMAEKKAVNIEESTILRGKHVTYLTNKVPLIDDDGNVLGICGVGFDITRQKKMEKALKEAHNDLTRRVEERTADLQKHLHFEQLLTNLSARFINLPPDAVDREIESGLRQILDLFDLDRCWLFKVISDKNAAYLTHLAMRKGVSRVPKGVNLVPHFPWILGKVFLGEVVSINTEDFPLEASADRRSATEIARFRYGLHIPLILRSEVRYMIGMTVDRSESVPGDDFVSRLRLIGEIFVNALERNLADQSLSESEKKYRIVADFTYDWEYWANLDGTLQYVSPSCERISGYAPGQFMDNPSLYREIIIPEDQNAWDKHYHDSRKELKAREIQFRIRARDGTIRWMEHACQPVIGDQGEILGFRASNRDITKRKEGEIKLQNAYLEIEQLKAQLEADQTYLREEIKLAHNYENIIGNSEKLKYNLFRVEQIAPTDTTVLILGETGTGKELIARAIHNASQRKGRPLIKVDCTSLPANLIESELFGHEKGAFTGADSRRVGRFELANGATIFLDEIGDLPLELQPKLLRVLQDGEFERLGSSQTLSTDVRVIAATNRNLEEDVENKKFRMDLLYRLSVYTITTPPLRDRVEDIGILVNFLVGKFDRKHGKRIRSIPTDTLAKLQNYSWPGNVRELENVIQRAVINTEGDKLQLEDDLQASRSGNAKSPDLPIKSLKEVEREHILAALRKTNWKIQGESGAAALLEINSSTLRGRMRKLGIHRPPYRA